MLKVLCPNDRRGRSDKYLMFELYLLPKYSGEASVHEPGSQSRERHRERAKGELRDRDRRDIKNVTRYGTMRTLDFSIDWEEQLCSFLAE